MYDYLFIKKDDPQLRVVVHGQTMYKAVRNLIAGYGQYRMNRIPSEDEFEIRKAKIVRKSRTTKTGMTEYYDDVTEEVVHIFKAISFQDAALITLEHLGWVLVS